MIVCISEIYLKAIYDNFQPVPAIGDIIFWKVFHLAAMPTAKSDKLLRDFGKHLQKLRTERKFSTRKFAYEADISHSSLGRLEAGLSNPTFTTLLKLANALEIEPGKLFEFWLLKGGWLDLCFYGMTHQYASKTCILMKRNWSNRWCLPGKAYKVVCSGNYGVAGVFNSDSFLARYFTFICY